MWKPLHMFAHTLSTPIYISCEALIDFDFSPMSPLLSTPRHFLFLSGWGGGTMCPLNSCPHANMNQDCLEINFCSVRVCPSRGSKKINVTFWYYHPVLPFLAKHDSATTMMTMVMTMMVMVMSMQSLWPWCRWPADPPLSCSTGVKRGAGEPLGGTLDPGRSH